MECSLSLFVNCLVMCIYVYMKIFVRIYVGRSMYVCACIDLYRSMYVSSMHICVCCCVFTFEFGSLFDGRMPASVARLVFDICY